MDRRLTAFLVFLALCLSSGGCGGPNQVSGKVTFEGKPVSLGTIVFVGADGAPQTSLIASDGTFEVMGLRPGLAKVAVISLDPAGLDPTFEAELQDKFAKMGLTFPTVAQTPSDWFPIPHAYADVETSQLTADIKPGTTQLEIKLENKGS